MAEWTGRPVVLTLGCTSIQSSEKLHVPRTYPQTSESKYLRKCVIILNKLTNQAKLPVILVLLVYELA